MKLTPNPIDAKRFLQIHLDGKEIYGYVARKESSGRPNVIHLEFTDRLHGHWKNLDALLTTLKGNLITWGSE